MSVDGGVITTVYDIRMETTGVQEATAILERAATAGQNLSATAKTATAAEVELGVATKQLIEAMNQLNTTLSSNSAGLTQRRSHVTESTKEDREWAVALREGSAGLREMLVPMAMLGAEMGPLTELIHGGAGALGSFGGAAISASSLGLNPLVIALGLGSAAVLGFAAATVSLGSQWEDTMTTIGIASQQTEEQVAAIGETLKRVSVETGTSAVALGDGYASVVGRLQLYNQNAALTDEQNQVLIKSAAMLSAVTGEDEKKSFDALATSVTALKLPLEEIPALADKLYNTSRVTGVGVDELADAIGRMSARAGPAGAAHDIDALLTTTIAASQAGLQGAQSFRLLNTVFDDMVSPTDKLMSQIKDLGINMADFSGADAQERLRMLGQHWIDLDNPTRVAAEAEELFSHNGGVAVTVMEGLAENGDAANKVLGEQGALFAANTQKQKDLTKEWNDWVESVKNFGMGVGLTFVQDLKNFGLAFDELGRKIQGARYEYEHFYDNPPKPPTESLPRAAAASIEQGRLSSSNDIDADTLHQRLAGSPESSPRGATQSDIEAGAAMAAQMRDEQAAAQANFEAIQALAQAQKDGTAADIVAAQAKQHETQALVEGITARHQEAEAAARFGESAKAAGQALEQIGEGVEPTNKQLETLWTEIDRLGTKNASALATSEQAKGLLTRIAGGDPAAYEQMIGLIKTLGDETEKAQKKAHVPPKTSEMGLEEGFAQGTPQARDLAGTAGGEAISALQKAAQDRADSIARTGEDSAAGPATAAASAALKAIDAARKAGVEGWEEYDAEVRPIMKKALEGDTDSLQEFIALMTELNQKTVDAETATKWAKSWDEAIAAADAKARGFADQIAAAETAAANQTIEEHQRAFDNEEAIAARSAERQVEIVTREAQQEVDEHQKAMDQRADADTEYSRKREDLSTKWAEEDDKLMSQEAAKRAEMTASFGDKEGDVARTASRAREDEATRLSRAQTDLPKPKAGEPTSLYSVMGSTGGGTASSAEDKLKEEDARKLQDIATQERRAQEDAQAAFSIQKRDEATRETQAAAERKINRDAEAKDADIAHTRKEDDITKEEGRRISAIQHAANDEKALDQAKETAQHLYFQTEEDKENTRHLLAMQHIELELSGKMGTVATTQSRDVEDAVDSARTKYQTAHNGSFEGFDEDQIRSDLASHLGAGTSSSRPQPASTLLTPSSTTNSAAANIDLNTGGGDGAAKPVAGAKTDDCQCITDAIKELANRPIQVYLDGKQIESSITKRQYQSVETRTSVGGTY